MARLTRRGFVKASGVLAAAPAFSALRVQAQGPPAPDTGNLRVEKDIVFGKGGDKDLTLDVYRPPAGWSSGPRCCRTSADTTRRWPIPGGHCRCCGGRAMPNGRPGHARTEAC